MKAIFVSLIFLFVCGCTSTEDRDPKNVTGIWKTESTNPYLIEYTEEMPKGKPVELEGMHLLERRSDHKWILTQRENGLITGTNQWTVYNEDGEKLKSLSEPMIGAIENNRIILIEKELEKTKHPQVQFECTLEGPNRMKCMGYDIGGEIHFVTRFILFRENKGP